MVKAKIDDIKKELEEEQEENYQDEAEEGLELDDDVAETYQKTFGHRPIEAPPEEEIDEPEEDK